MDNPTIVDVARAAEVSVATASRVLSGSDYPVKKETRERILKAARELDYTPNMFSRILRGKQSRHIGVLVPSITNPFYSQVLSAIQRTCLAGGYIPLITTSSDERELEERLDLFRQEHVAGMLVSSLSWSDEIRGMLDCIGAPYVLFDQVADDYDGSFVGFDFFQAGMAAAACLADRGHMDIMLATTPVTRISRKAYLSGFRKEAEARGAVCRILECPDEADDYESGLCLARMIMKLGSMPSAIAAINDITAFGIMRGLIAEGIRIPDDISIIGFDDIPYSNMVTPPLTTIRQPAAETGQLASQMLLSLMTGTGRPESVRFSPELVIRDSVKEVGK